MKIYHNVNSDSLEAARKFFLEDGVIALPTDTNYNLICNPYSSIAIDKIFRMKNRKKDKSLSLFFANPTDWKKYGFSENNEYVEKIIQKFWPGPLNIVLSKTDLVPSEILVGGSTVSLGCISNPIWMQVVTFLQSPVALTSANQSGMANDQIVTFEMAVEHIGAEVDAIFFDNNPSQSKKSSTIIDMTSKEIKLIRLGELDVQNIKSRIN